MCMIVIYVDDLIIDKTAVMHRIFAELKKKFEINDSTPFSK